MSSARAFPMVDVTSITAGTTVVGEKEEPPKQITDVTEDLVPEKVQGIMEGEEHIFYTMSVKATKERVANIRARAFVRAKNPFEPSRLDITHSELVEKNVGPLGLQNKYTVSVGVSK